MAVLRAGRDAATHAEGPLAAADAVLPALRWLTSLLLYAVCYAALQRTQSEPSDSPEEAADLLGARAEPEILGRLIQPC